MFEMKCSFVLYLSSFLNFLFLSVLLHCFQLLWNFYFSNSVFLFYFESLIISWNWFLPFYMFLLFCFVFFLIDYLELPNISIRKVSKTLVKLCTFSVPSLTHIYDTLILVCLCWWCVCVWFLLSLDRNDEFAFQVKGHEIVGENRVS